MDTAAQDDAALVEALRRGERAGLEGMYRRYADRLYTYARALLREPEAAADAVHDAFLTAGQRIDQLREPERLRPWLYAIVRTQCLRQLRERSRALPLEDAGEPVADTADPAAAVHAEQVRDLVHTAAAALNPGDREVVHLAIRHGLSSADIGAALGVPANHAHARMSRARSQLEGALGALLVARTGAGDCPDLAVLIEGWQGRLTPILRKRVSRHIEGCVVCGLLRREQLDPAALLSAYTAPAFLVAADMVSPRSAEAPTTEDLAEPTPDPMPNPTPDPMPDPAAAAGAPAEGRSTGPADGPGDEFPVPAGATAARDGTAMSGTTAAHRAAAHGVPTTAGPVRDRRRRRMAAMSALLALVAISIWALAPGRRTAAPPAPGRPAAGTLAAPAGAPTAAAAQQTSGTSAAARTRPAAPAAQAGSASPKPRNPAGSAGGDSAGRPGTSAAPDPGPVGVSPTPPATPTRSPGPPRPSGTPRIVTLLTVSATARTPCRATTYTLVVRATGSATLRGAELRWTPTGGRTATRAMTVDGATARVTVGRLRASTLTWSVRATSTDGRTAQSPVYSAADPCVRPG
jgi:RNA polymerase sigma factor (sigma-70 family)